MTESRMEAMVEQEQRDALTQAYAEPDFYARVHDPSLDCGPTILLTDGPGGAVLGELLLFGFGQDVNLYAHWAQRLSRALNNGRKAEQMISRLLTKGVLAGDGKPARSAVAPVDVRKFVGALDKLAQGGEHGAAIRRDQKTTNH